MQRALVVGGSGFFGRHLLERLGDRGVGTHLNRPAAGTIRFDAATERLRDRLADLPSDLTHVFVPFGVIDMEGCARDYDGTARVNVAAVQGVLADAAEAGLRAVHVSTDYVFSGDRPLWSETDEAQPRMAYGRQKLIVEQWLQARHPEALICRLSKVLSDRMERENMLANWAHDIRAARPLQLAADQCFSPAGADDLADAMIALADAGASGLFHVAGPERISRLDLFRRLSAAMAEHQETDMSLAQACSLHDLGFLETRPLDTSLDVSRLERTISHRFSSIDDLCRKVAAMHAGGSEAAQAEIAPGFGGR
jgi:dTDP-4-dehydrorhamnose reductase